MLIPSIVSNFAASTLIAIHPCPEVTTLNQVAIQQEIAKQGFLNKTPLESLPPEQFIQTLNRTSISQATPPKPAEPKPEPITPPINPPNPAPSPMPRTDFPQPKYVLMNGGQIFWS